MTDAPLVLRHDDGGVATLVLNRPLARNSLSQGLLSALVDEFAALAGNPNVRVVVVAGAGPAFCAGLQTSAISLEAYLASYFLPTTSRALSATF